MRRRWRAVEGGGRGWGVAALACIAFSSTALHRFSPPSTVQSRDVILATTTSTRDAGLLDSLLPVFERQTHYTVKVIAVGSGQALAMGRRGDADVVLSHAPEAERALVDSGYFVRRRIVMHNEFLIVGPARDPAGLRGLSDPVAAFRKVAERRGIFVSRGDQSGTHQRNEDAAPLGDLAERRGIFVSRGDQSGTHQREQLLWKRAGFPSPPRGEWYIESGQGMGATLQLADEKHGYTLTDPATYLTWRGQLQPLPIGLGGFLLDNEEPPLGA